MTKLPRNVHVEITSKASIYEGQTGFVLRRPGDVKADGENVPDGMYQIVFDPVEVGGLPEAKKMFSEDEIELTGYC